MCLNISLDWLKATFFRKYWLSHWKQCLADLLIKLSHRLCLADFENGCISKCERFKGVRVQKTHYRADSIFRNFFKKVKIKFSKLLFLKFALYFLYKEVNLFSNFIVIPFDKLFDIFLWFLRVFN
jgi:hypothetical protein